MFSEGNAANPVWCDSPLQIEIWQAFLKFKLPWLDVTALY
jgi:hypothetical protein